MSRHDYSMAERALAFWCPLTLMVLSVTSLGLRYVKDPISCWCPAQFEPSQVNYANNYCFHRHYVHPVWPWWVSFTLGVLAVLCFLPHFLWRMLSASLWLDAHTLAQALGDNQRQNAAGRHAMLRDCAVMLQAGLRAGSWGLAAAAMVRKALWLLTCVAVMLLAATVFQPLVSATPTKTNITTPLPEVIHCYFEIRQMQNVHDYIVQCTFPFSQVYKKGFTFIFYLFVLLAVSCVLDMLTYMARLAIPGLRDIHLKRFVAAAEGSRTQQPNPQIAPFLESLGLDGRLVLAVVADACGPLAAADLTGHMWTAFKGTPHITAASAPAVPNVYTATTVGGSPAPAQGSSDPPLSTGDGGSEVYPLLPMSEKGDGTTPVKC